MVGVAQLVEPLIVVQEVARSSRVAHPGKVRTFWSGPFPFFHRRSLIVVTVVRLADIFRRFWGLEPLFFSETRTAVPEVCRGRRRALSRLGHGLHRGCTGLHLRHFFIPVLHCLWPPNLGRGCTVVLLRCRLSCFLAAFGGVIPVEGARDYTLGVGRWGLGGVERCNPGRERTIVHPRHPETHPDAGCPGCAGSERGGRGIGRPR